MKGKNQLLAIILIVVLAVAAGFGGGFTAVYLTNRGTISFDGGRADSLPNASDITINAGDDATIAEAIANKVLPSVVGISTVSEQSYSSGFMFGFGFGNGDGYTYDAESVGTGVIVDEAGYILTNSHVVNDGDTKSITVSLFDGTDVSGTVLWNDSTLDLAVVKIDAGNLISAELGDSDTLSIGSYAAVIGNPLGLEFERSMSQGIVSGLNRTIQVSNGNGGATTMEGLIQTDATINSGNSGGPLLNSKGQVVGINSAKATNGEGLGFAIPINVAKPIVDQIKDSGSFERPYIGVSGVGLEEQAQYSKEQLLEAFGTDNGIYVAEVLTGGGAEAAGIKKGDIIIALNDESVGTMNKLNKLIIAYRPGDTVELTVLRDGKERTYTVTLTDGNTTI